MVLSIILAGGSGSRIGGETPKQFIEVSGKPIIAYTIEAFERHSLVDEIIVVCKSEYIDLIHDMIDANGYKKVVDVIPGGKERYESSMAALSHCTSPDDKLLIHDCARPMVSERIISDCIGAMDNYDAVTVAIPASDTIYVSDNKEHITDIPARASLRQAQTPQCFKASTIKEAYNLALSDEHFNPTDDCSVVFKYLPSCPIHIVEGDPVNIKITYKEDIEIFENYLSSLPSK